MSASFYSGVSVSSRCPSTFTDRCFTCLGSSQTGYVFSLGCCHRCWQPWVWHAALHSVWRLWQAGQTPPLPDPPTDRRALCLSGHRSGWRTDSPRHSDKSWRSSEWSFAISNWFWHTLDLIIINCSLRCDHNKLHLAHKLQLLYFTGLFKFNAQQ